MSPPEYLATYVNAFYTDDKLKLVFTNHTMEFNVLLKSFQINYYSVYEGSMKIEGIISPQKTPVHILVINQM